MTKLKPSDVQNLINTATGKVNAQIEIFNTGIAKAADVFSAISGDSTASYLESFKELELCLQGISETYAESVDTLKNTANVLIEWDSSTKSTAQITTGTEY